MFRLKSYCDRFYIYYFEKLVHSPFFLRFDHHIQIRCGGNLTTQKNKHSNLKRMAIFYCCCYCFFFGTFLHYKIRSRLKKTKKKWFVYLRSAAIQIEYYDEDQNQVKI